MLIFSRYNLVLLAVPKTGSTALEVALGQEADGRFGNPPEMKHLPLYRYNRFVRPLLQLTTGQDPETFALIREPISWLRSWYRYRARNSMALLPTSTCHISFDQFVREAMSDDPPPFAQVGCQTRFLSPGGREPFGIGTGSAVAQSSGHRPGTVGPRLGGTIPEDPCGRISTLARRFYLALAL